MDGGWRADDGGVKGKIKVAWKLQYSEEDKGGPLWVKQLKQVTDWARQCQAAVQSSRGVSKYESDLLRQKADDDDNNN